MRWAGDRDVLAGVAYLQDRPDVESDRVGAMGFSVGGEMLLRAAAQTQAIRAVVSEGAGERVGETDVSGPARFLVEPSQAVMTAATTVFSNHTPPPAIVDRIGDIAPRPVLLIYADPGIGGESTRQRGYFAAAGAPKSIWKVPGSDHTGGLAASTPRVRAARRGVLRRRTPRDRGLFGKEQQMTNTQTRRGTGSDTIWQLSTRTRRVLLLAPPLVLAVFTVLHPQPDENAPSLMDASTWFMGFHMIQLGLVGLVAVSVFVLADQFHRAHAWQTCLGMGLFLVYFSAYDTLAGIGTGLAMRSARDLPTSQQEALFDIVKNWPGLEPWVFWLSIVGTFGWVLALGYLAVVARGAHAPRSEWLFVALAAFFLLLGHPAPFGTIAFGSLFLAAVIHERRSTHVPAANQPDNPRPALTE